MKEPSAARAAELLRRCKVAALGTVHHGAPSVSMVPYAIIEDPLAFVVLVSTLSAHTKEMLEDPNVALMIMEPETGTKPPHTLARVSMQGRAEPISQGDPRFGAARAALQRAISGYGWAVRTQRLHALRDRSRYGARHSGLRASGLDHAGVHRS